MAFHGNSRRWSSVDINTELKCGSLRRSSDSAVGKRLPVQLANLKHYDSETGFNDEEQDSDESIASEESFCADNDSDSSSSSIAGDEPENAKAQKLKARSDIKSRRNGNKEPITRPTRVTSFQVVPAGLVRFRRAVRKTMMAARFKRKESHHHGVCVKDVSTRAKQRYSVLFRTITDQRELEFLQELFRSLPILLNETSWLVEVFKACNDFEGRAPARHVCDLIAKSMHWLKMLTARYCWARNVEPMREELTKIYQKHEELKRQFHTARSSYLLEVSSLRNRVQTRADVSEVLGKRDCKGNVEMFCPIMVLHEDERTFFMEAVEEKLKMLVDVGKNGDLAANMSQINAFNEAQREDDLRELNKEIEENRQKVAKLEKRCYTLEKEAKVAKQTNFASSSAADDKNVKLLNMQVGKLKQQLKETTFEGENALAVAQADIATKIADIEAMRNEIMELKEAIKNRNAAEAAKLFNVGVEIVIPDVKAETVKQEIVDFADASHLKNVTAFSGSQAAVEESSATEPQKKPRRDCFSLKTFEQNEAAMESEEPSNCSDFQHGVLKQEITYLMTDAASRIYQVADGIERSDLSMQSLGTLRSVMKEAFDNVVNAVSQHILDCNETSPKEGDVENVDFDLGFTAKTLFVHPEEILQPPPVSKNVADSKTISIPKCFQPKFKLSAECAECAEPALVISTVCQPPQKKGIDFSDVIGDHAFFPESPTAWPSLPADTQQSTPSVRRGRRRIPPRSVTDPSGPMGDFLALKSEPAVKPTPTTTVDPENAFVEKYQNESFTHSSISKSGNSNKGSFRNPMPEISSSRFRSSSSGGGVKGIAIPVQRMAASSGEEAPHLSPVCVSSRKHYQSVDSASPGEKAPDLSPLCVSSRKQYHSVGSELVASEFNFNKISNLRRFYGSR